MCRVYPGTEPSHPVTLVFGLVWFGVRNTVKYSIQCSVDNSLPYGVNVVYKTLYSIVFITAYIIVYGLHYMRPEEMRLVPQRICQLRQ